MNTIQMGMMLRKVFNARWIADDKSYRIRQGELHLLLLFDTRTNGATGDSYIVQLYLQRLDDSDAHRNLGQGKRKKVDSMSNVHGIPLEVAKKWLAKAILRAEFDEDGDSTPPTTRDL
jgi:hypothetical protein